VYLPFRFNCTTQMSVDSNMNDIVISTHGVECAIDRLPTNSSPGPDGISTKLLKLTKPISGHLLARLFQQSLSTGELPDDWKNACSCRSYFQSRR
ncbi:MAG: hypothetical protein PV344_00285, partial [Anaplasma sp.]|nr:hypothetical protein [Anaplasma sp.]